jgi:hypothetical protein
MKDIKDGDLTMKIGMERMNDLFSQHILSDFRKGGWNQNH